MRARRFLDCLIAGALWGGFAYLLGGRAAIAATAQGFMTAFPDMVVKLDSVSPAGLIAESRGHYDEAEYQRQLKSGAPPPP